MAARKTPRSLDEALARRVVAVTAELAGRSVQKGIAVGNILAQLGTEDAEAVDRAIALAVERGWLRSAGSPPFSVQLRVDGLKITH